MKRDKKQIGYLFLIITFVLWGSLYVVSKYTLGKLPPFTISFFRFLLAFLALSLIKKEKSPKIERKDYKYILLIGVVGYFISVGAQLLGTKYAGASLASLLNSLNPVTMTVFAAIFLKEKLTLRKIAGLILSLCGVYAILGGGGGQQSLSGIILSLLSVFLWSGVSVFMRKITQKYDSLQITRWGVGVAVLCYLPVCIAEMARGGMPALDVSCVTALLYMGLICTGGAYYLWNRSLSLLEAGTCSAFYPVQPLVSATFAAIFLGEALEWSFWMGAAFIVFGVFLSLIKTKNRI